jgi:hypothetical protein
MAELRKKTLPSGAVLSMNVAPFKEAKALYQALMKELRSIPIKSDTEFAELWKNLYTAGFSSKEVEEALVACMGTCTYNTGPGQEKLTMAVFEDEKNRVDYEDVCIALVEINVLPFANRLYAQYKQLLTVPNGSTHA